MKKGITVGICLFALLLLTFSCKYKRVVEEDDQEKNKLILQLIELDSLEKIMEREHLGSRSEEKTERHVIEKSRNASIIKAMKELIAYGGTLKDVKEIIIANKRKDIQQKIERYSDIYKSILYVSHPKEMKKWKPYKVIGDLRNVLGSNTLELSKRVIVLAPSDHFSHFINREVLVPNQVRLTLKGSQFEINPLFNNGWQTMESIYACKWLWEVIPIERDGQARLHFILEGKNDLGEIYHISDIEGIIKVSGGYGKDLANHWQWIAGTILLPLSAWLAGAGRWRRVWEYLKWLFKKKKVVKVEDVQKEEAKEREGGK